MVAVSHAVEPDGATADVYAELFEIFRLAYETAAARGVYRRIYEFQRRYF
jgi:hypothetical protein